MGKLLISGDLQGFFEDELSKNAIELLAIAPRHATLVATLAHHHRDPFDRLWVAQAIAEGLPLLSADAALDPNGIRRLG